MQIEWKSYARKQKLPKNPRKQWNLASIGWASPIQNVVSLQEIKGLDLIPPKIWFWIVTIPYYTVPPQEKKIISLFLKK